MSLKAQVVVLTAMLGKDNPLTCELVCLSPVLKGIYHYALSKPVQHLGGPFLTNRKLLRNHICKSILPVMVEQVMGDEPTSEKMLVPQALEGGMLEFRLRLGAGGTATVFQSSHLSENLIGVDSVHRQEGMELEDEHAGVPASNEVIQSQRLGNVAQPLWSAFLYGAVMVEAESDFRNRRQ